MINVSWGGWLAVRLWWFVVVDIVVLCVCLYKGWLFGCWLFWGGCYIEQNCVCVRVVVIDDVQ